MDMDRLEKLKILAEGAKYDVSCVSSGSSRKNTSGGLGESFAAGICHSFAADGRCISLLKILMSNDCVFNCAYCVNRISNDVPRVTFSPREIADITVQFYRRNYIEGLFLSSAVYKNADYTMELILRTIPFFTVAANAITELEGPLLELNFKIPGVLYKGAFKILFYFILPYGVMATVPTQFITGTLSLPGLLQALGVVTVFTVLALRFWRFGLKHYKSASS